MTSMASEYGTQRLAPELTFAAAVALRFDTPTAVGETADGVRFDFPVHGTVTGPLLNGKFPPCTAYLLIDPDGVGTINVRAPLMLDDGAVAELEATGRYDFGEDGYRRAVAKDLPNSALGWCPRFLTGHPRYLWLNRALFLGVGELRPRETRVDYDLYRMTPGRGAAAGARPAAARGSTKQRSLYERLGGRPGINRVVDAFIDALHSNETLNRQNPKLAAAHSRVDLPDLKQKVADLICKMASGPCRYTGRSMKESHANLDITEADWAVASQDLVAVLNRLNIGRAEQEDLYALLGSTKPDIVTRA
jgi:hemoglobin